MYLCSTDKSVKKFKMSQTPGQTVAAVHLQRVSDAGTDLNHLK